MAIKFKPTKKSMEIRAEKKAMVIMKRAIAIADAATWYCAFVLVALILLTSIREISSTLSQQPINNIIHGRKLFSSTTTRPPCDEIYIVNEGETLHTISDKCGDPYIVEENPHIQDPDDVFPGLVIKITPHRKLV